MSATDIQDPNRRDFLYVATGMAAVVGAGAVASPFIDQMRPDASTLALASVVEMSPADTGTSPIVKWRGKPVVRNRNGDSGRRGGQAYPRIRSPATPNLPADAPATDANRTTPGKEA